jgi:hypothetical protein
MLSNEFAYCNENGSAINKPYNVRRRMVFTKRME